MAITFDNFEYRFLKVIIFLSCICSSVFGQIQYVSVISTLIIVSWAFTILFYKLMNHWGISKVELLPFLFFCYILIDSIIHYNGFEDIRFVAFCAIYLIVLANIFQKKSLYRSSEMLFDSLELFIRFVTILNAIGLLAYVVGFVFSFNGTYYIRYNGYGDFNGLFLNPNTVGGMSFLSIVFVFLKKKNIKRNFFNSYLILIINLLSLIVCASRSSIGALLICFSCYLLLSYKSKITAAIFIISALLIIYFNLDNMLNLSAEIAGKSNVDSEDSLNGRNLLWIYAIQIFLDNIWFGVGFSNLSMIALKLNPDLIYVGFLGGGFHNTYLQIGGTLGVFGLLFLITIIVHTLLTKPCKNSNISSIVLLLKSLIISVCFQCLFETNLLYSLNSYTILFWIIISYINKITSTKCYYQ